MNNKTFGFKIKNKKLGRIEYNFTPSISGGMNIRTMRPLQKEAFLHTAHHPFSWINMPTGAGKSSVGTFIAGENLISDNRLKVIIAVPQLTIAKSFRHLIKNKPTRFVYEEPGFKMGDEDFEKWVKTNKIKSVEWAIENDLTISETLQLFSTVDSLIDFLKSKGTTPRSRVVLCTHQTLVATYRKLERQNNLKEFQNIKFIIDEAHHIVDQDDHGLGDFVNWVFEKYKTQNLQLLLMTATPFRGDMRRIIHKDYLDLFKDSTYVLPFDRYMQHMQFLKCFDYGFSCYNYKNGTKEALKESLSNKQSKTLIFLPRRTPNPASRFPSINKNDETNEVVEGIIRSYGWTGNIEKRPKILGNGNSVSSIFEVRVGQNEWKTIVDLVEDDGSIRNQVKNSLDRINDEKDFADYIIALEIGKEGFDWQWCDQVIIFGKLGSLTQLVQITGRPLRDVIGKPKAKVIQYLPIDVNSISSTEEFIEELNDVFNAVCLSMLMYEVMEPIFISIPAKNKSKTKTISGTELMASLISNENERQEFLKKSLMEISNKQISEGRELTLDERVEIVSNMMSNEGLGDRIDECAIILAKYLKTRHEKTEKNQQILKGLKGLPILEEVRKTMKYVVGEIPAEASIASWIAKEMHAPKLSEYHKAVQKFTGEDLIRADDEKVIQLTEFKAKHGRKPSTRANNQEEKILANWLSSFLNRSYNKMRIKQEREKLKAVA